MQKKGFGAIKFRMRRKKSLKEKYPPSEPRDCSICLSYCQRPGWWTVEEAARAILAGYGPRMKVERPPERCFSVLSPAIKGCVVAFAAYSLHGCTFLNDKHCELHSTGFEPLECRFCHHDRIGMGPRCHADLEKDWNKSAGRAPVERLIDLTNFWQNLAGSIPAIS